VGKTEVQVVVAAPIDRVWQALTDVERWPEYTRLLESSRWASGERWAFGSSLKAKITWPFPLTVTLVVTGFQPNAELRWVTHAIGMVIERWTRLTAQGSNTKIDSSAIYFAPSMPELPGELTDILPQFAERFFADFKSACERIAA
jgi:hypothetical protein